MQRRCQTGHFREQKTQPRHGVVFVGWLKAMRRKTQSRKGDSPRLHFRAALFDAYHVHAFLGKSRPDRIFTHSTTMPLATARDIGNNPFLPRLANKEKAP